MNINIIVPFKDAELNCEVWANSENSIDFSKDLFEAARCTVCFAASEIKSWLQKANIACVYNSGEETDRVIEIELDDYKSKSEEYTLTPTEKGVKIEGVGRAGVLYGCYEFLKLQGYAWFSPGMTGTVTPKELNTLVFPEKEITFTPDYNAGRGFDFENYSIESAETWVWMARNRLNVGAYSPKFYALQKKLCITIKTGGHIFEKMLNPDRMLDDGKTIFESHKDWYGVREDGLEPIPQNCLKTQFCVCNKELIDFLSNELIAMFKNEWKFVERADIWGFDTWGSVCCCESCRQLGNPTDVTLHFIAELRKALNKTDIKDRVRLISCAYEGTCTMAPPSRPIPQVLLDADDCVVFYPINRCYEHDFADEACPTNKRYNDYLSGWSRVRGTMPFVMGEYYNVSRFEDLPFMFINRIKNDFPHYYSMGVRGVTYMHFPLMNMGLRSLTHLLYAELAWNTRADADKIIDTYFELYYEKYAKQMKQLYYLLEDASTSCAQWRSWSGSSILSQFIDWRANKAPRELRADTHLTSHQEIINSGKYIVDKMSAALKIADDILDEELYTPFEYVLTYSSNPVELRQKAEQTKLLKRLSEVKCLTLYGVDTFKLMTLLVQIYDGLYNDKDVSGFAKELAALYKKMDDYYIPVASDALVVDTVCKTALERTQLKLLAKKCISEYAK